MKRSLIALLFLMLFGAVAGAQIIITEIMYNPPESGTDTLEYIELYNNSANPVDVSGWSFKQGVVFTFPAGTTMQPGQYAVVCEDTAYFRARFPNLLPYQWSNAPMNSALTNGGETVELVNASNAFIDSVRYRNVAPWPTGANGGGASIVLCDFNADNNVGTNWIAATTPTGVTSGGSPVFANPGGPSGCVPITYPNYTIAQVTTENANGVADSINVTCTLTGIVYGVNINLPNGLQFALIDNSSNKGIVVFLQNGNLGYNVNQGDQLSVKGRVSQFRGLTQFSPDSIALLSGNNGLTTPNVVVKPTEDTETSYIRINNLHLVNPAQWKGDGTAYNVLAVSDDHPQDTILIRIDDNTDLSTKQPPTSPFDLLGIGGQFGPTAPPFNSGYQMLPNFETDVIGLSSTQLVDWSREISISPNPAGDWIGLNTNLALDRLVVSDAAGRVVMNIANPHIFNQMPLGDLTPGVYVFRFEAGAQFWATRVVKQ